MTHPTPAPEPEPGHPPLQILHLSFKETLVLPGARQRAAAWRAIQWRIGVARSRPPPASPHGRPHRSPGAR